MIIRTLFHLIPVIPIVIGRPYLIAASLFLVALPYIKCLKFEAEIRNSVRKDERNTAAEAVLARWQKLTFLGALRQLQRKPNSEKKGQE